jgi:hypothetical protein
MRKTIVFIALNLIFVGFTIGQTKLERQKAISIIENLMYNEYYLGVKHYEKTEITYNEIDDRIEINVFAFFGEDKNIKVKTSFYIDDLDLKTMEYDLFEHEDGLLSVLVYINAKGESIEEQMVDTNKSEFPTPVSSTKYRNKLRFSTSKALPKPLAEKFVENIKILIGASEYKKAKLFKS